MGKSCKYYAMKQIRYQRTNIVCFQLYKVVFHYFWLCSMWDLSSLTSCARMSLGGRHGRVTSYQNSPSPLTGCGSHFYQLSKINTVKKQFISLGLDGRWEELASQRNWPPDMPWAKSCKGFNSFFCCKLAWPGLAW